VVLHTPGHSRGAVCFDRLLVIDPDTIVHTGHGPDTTIGAERPHLQEWIARGHGPPPS
jgi:glyoxylase-like metal-dependent hydrolase (beta-lactamase superfamily II)